MQHHGDHSCFQRGRPFDGQIDRFGRFRLDPIAKAAERAVSGQRRANFRSQRIEQLTCPPVVPRS